MLYGHFYGWDLVCPKEFGMELMGTYAQFDHSPTNSLGVC